MHSLGIAGACGHIIGPISANLTHPRQVGDGHETARHGLQSYVMLAFISLNYLYILPKQLSKWLWFRQHPPMKIPKHTCLPLPVNPGSSPKKAHPPRNVPVNRFSEMACTSISLALGNKQAPTYPVVPAPNEDPKGNGNTTRAPRPGMMQ